MHARQGMAAADAVRRLHAQWGALIGAAGFLLLTLLFWRLAGIGLFYWLVVDATAAVIGAFIGLVVFSESNKT